MAVKRQPKQKIDLSLGPKYGLGELIDKEQFFETARKVAEISKGHIPPDEFLEMDYQDYLNNYETELKKKIKEEKKALKEKKPMAAESISKEMLKKVPDDIVESCSRILVEVAKIMNESEHKSELLKQSNEYMAEGTETLKKANEYFRDSDSKLKEAEEKLKASDEKIAQLEQDVANLRMGNSDLMDKLSRAYKAKIKFVMIRPDRDLKEYIHTLEDMNDSLTKENEIYKEYYDKFKKAEDDLHTADQVCSQYEEENEKLRIENQKLHGKIMSQDIQINSYKDRYGSRSIINYGQETDIYSGEIRDMVLSILAEKFANCEDIGSRQAIVLRDILENNEKDGTRDELRRFLFNLFKDYKGFTSLDTSALAEHGFDVAKGSKHAEVFFKNYPKIQAPISATPSDGAHMQNNAACIAAKLL